MVSNCGFDLHFLVTNDIEHLFMCLYIFFGEISVFIRLFVFLLMSCKCSSYILAIGPLSDTWFVNIFSHSVSEKLYFIWIAYLVALFLYFNFFNYFTWAQKGTWSKKSGEIWEKWGYVGQRVKSYNYAEWISPRELMYGVVTAVNNTVLYTWNLLREPTLSLLITHKKIIAMWSDGYVS